MNPFKPLALAALAFASLAASAHPPPRAAGVLLGPARVATPQIDARQARQAARIHRGVVSGRLTAHEATRLHAVQRRIARVEHHGKADGVVTAAERRRLHALLDRSSRLIRHQKHDRQTAGR